jgi:hypothetical protein
MDRCSGEPTGRAASMRQGVGLKGVEQYRIMLGKIQDLEGCTGPITLCCFGILVINLGLRR